jgi:hypothetical protein
VSTAAATSAPNSLAPTFTSFTVLVQLRAASAWRRVRNVNWNKRGGKSKIKSGFDLTDVFRRDVKERKGTSRSIHWKSKNIMKSQCEWFKDGSEDRATTYQSLQTSPGSLHHRPTDTKVERRHGPSFPLSRPPASGEQSFVDSQNNLSFMFLFGKGNIGKRPDFWRTEYLIVLF